MNNAKFGLVPSSTEGRKNMELERGIWVISCTDNVLYLNLSCEYIATSICCNVL